jgi:hypothetical protein
LEHAKEVGLVKLPASDEAAEIMQPGEQSFDFPAAVTPPLLAILGFVSAVAAIRCDHLDAVLAPQLPVQRVAVIGRIADHTPGLGRANRLSMVFSMSFVSWGEALAMPQGIGKPWRSAITMILLPFPRRVRPTAAPLFSPS